VSDDAQAPVDSTQQPTRFEVTVHVERERPTAEAEARISALDLDRIPDRDDVRLLVSMDDAARLVGQGFEVRVLRAVPVRPLDADLIASDDQVRGWFDDRVGRAVEDEAGPDTEPDPANGEGGGR